MIHLSKERSVGFDSFQNKRWEESFSHPQRNGKKVSLILEKWEESVTLEQKHGKTFSPILNKNGNEISLIQNNKSHGFSKKQEEDLSPLGPPQFYSLNFAGCETCHKNHDRIAGGRKNRCFNAATPVFFSILDCGSCMCKWNFPFETGMTGGISKNFQRKLIDGTPLSQTVHSKMPKGCQP